MTVSREELFAKILDKYSIWYDVTEHGEEAAPLRFSATYHEHDAGYMLSRKAEMWSADKHEYAYFFSVEHLDVQTAEACIAKARELGEPLIVPKEGHMCSVIVAAILCDTADEAAVKLIRSCKIKKSYQFSLKGWMEVHTAVLEVGKDSVTANGSGKNTGKFLDSLLHPVAKRKKENMFLKVLRDLI